MKPFDRRKLLLSVSRALVGALSVLGCGLPPTDLSCSRKVSVERLEGDLLIIRPEADPLIGCGQRARDAGLECPSSTPDELRLSETFYRRDYTTTIPFVIMEMPATNGQVADCVRAGKCAPVRLEAGQEPAWMMPARAQEYYEFDYYHAGYEYCLARGMVTCSEVQWELAARGRSNYLFAWGDSPADDCRALTGETLEEFLKREDISEFGVRVLHSFAEGTNGAFADYRTGCAIGTYATPLGEDNPCGEVDAPVPPCCRPQEYPLRGGLYPLYFRRASAARAGVSTVVRCCGPLPESR